MNQGKEISRESYVVTQDTKAVFERINENGSFRISINDQVVEYLDQCVKAIDFEQQRSVFIFDMDGTLYQLDNMDGFEKSLLGKIVRQNALQLIIQKENCSYEDAETVYKEGTNNPIGLSQYAAEKYTISRKEYFDTVWNIDPTNIIKNFNQSVATVNRLKMCPDKKLVLLTSAPSVWASRVLKTLGLENAFELVFTAEQFTTKDEIFRLLSEWYRPENGISIGDQEKTDIIPAQNYGFQTFLVSSPNTLNELLG